MDFAEPSYAPMIIFAVITAVLTTILTLSASYVFFVAYLRQKIYEEIIEELQSTTGYVKEQLREGVLEAGQELMPEFREEVREGFKEALSSVMSGDLIEHTTRKMAQNSQTIVEQGLGILLGRKPFETDPPKKPEGS